MDDNSMKANIVGDDGTLEREMSQITAALRPKVSLQGGFIPRTPIQANALGDTKRLSNVLHPTVLPYEQDFRRFVDAMLYKIKKNGHKGRWDTLSLKDAVDLLKGELAELEVAISDGNRVEIELEAADVANFALIIASIAVEKGK